LVRAVARAKRARHKATYVLTVARTAKTDLGLPFSHSFVLNP